ncbi:MULTISPECIES: hypothetical protein [unclassified Ekhidna]|jgi:hypothetical protein|uniref:hypothetical protein n=1 Tax=unclassified Ekhidna TaxID=2632188 RepID=UPI0032DFEABB
MRKLFAIFLLFGSLTSFSQLKEGAKAIDLSLAYNKTDYASYQVLSNFFIQPLVGFAKSENQLIYVGIRYEKQKYDYSSSISDRNLTSLVVGFERLFELSPKIYFSPFLSGTVGLGTQEDSSMSNNLKAFTVSLRPRLHYFINGKWSVVASVGAIEYQREIQNNDFVNFAQEYFSANLNASNVFFGIRLNLNNE